MNHESPITNHNLGFTLIEILVVISVLTVVGVVLTEVFFRSIRGGNKAEAVAILKQNGQESIDIMDKNIRNSKDVICPPLPPSITKKDSDVLAIIGQDGTITRYRLSDQKLLEDHPKAAAGITQEQFVLNLCSNLSLEGTEQVALTDINKITVYKPEGSNIFIRSRQSGYRDVVTVSFRLKPGAGIPKAVGNQIDPIPFTTTVQLR